MFPKYCFWRHSYSPPVRFIFSLASVFALLHTGEHRLLRAQDNPFTIERTIATQGFDGKMCWVHARAGILPIGEGEPSVVMTTQKLQLSGSDVFYALNELRTEDGGISWSSPVEHSSFAREPFSFDGVSELQITVCDFAPKWHYNTQTLLGIGQTVVYENNRVRRVRPRHVAFATYDASAKNWAPWRKLELPREEKFRDAGAGSVQRHDLENGDILVPIYFKEMKATQYSTTVLRCSFDGEQLTYKTHGNEMTVPVKRGLYEPSIAEHAGKLYLTMRNDDHAYVSVCNNRDSLKFSPPKKWTFDDGSDLGSYNTQQHWLTHAKHGLWLAYTRRGANNDHVFRHRAPLFIAKVDPISLHVIRSTERILVPEKGARLGNFGVTEIGPNETWVTVTEWMQGPGKSAHDPSSIVARGADNRIWVAKVIWK